MMSGFVEEYKASIHHVLNAMWEAAETTREMLRRKGFKVGGITHGIGNYIFIGGEYQRASYCTPEFGFEKGVVWCNLNGLGFTSAVKRQSVTRSFLSKLIDEIEGVEVYGGKDYERDFYPGHTVEEAYRMIIESSEQTIQISIRITRFWDNIPAATQELINRITRFTKIVEEFKVEVLNPLLRGYG